MPTAQIRNASMQELGSADHLTTDNKNFAAEWRDTAGGTSFLGGTTVPLAGEILNTAPTVFVMASNIVTLTEAGLYLFLYSVTAANSGSAEMIFNAYLEEDPDTGSFATILGSPAVGTFFNGSGTVANHVLIRSGIDYRYRLAVARLGGSVTPTLVQNMSKLSIVRLFKNG